MNKQFVATESHSLKSIISTSFISLLNLVIQTLCLLAISLLAARNLDVDDAANWMVLVALVPFMMIFDFGLGPYMAKEIPFLQTRENTPKLINSFILSNFLGLSSALGLVAFIPFLISFFSPSIGSISTKIFAFMLLGGLLRVLLNVISSVFYGFGFLFIDRILRIASNLTFLGLLLLILQLEKSLWSFVSAWFISNLVILALATIILHKKVSLSFQGLRFRLLFLKRSFSFLFQYTLSIIPGLFIFNASIFIVKIYHNSETVFKIGVINQIMQGILAVCIIPNFVFNRTISKRFFENSSRVNETLDLVISVGSLIGGSLCGFWLIHLNNIFAFWNFSFRAFYILPYIILILLEIPQVALTSAVISTGYANFFKVATASAGLVILFSFIFVKDWGILGAGLGLLFAQCLTCDIFNTMKAKRIFNLKLSFILKSFLQPAGYCLVFLLLNLTIQQILPSWALSIMINVLLVILILLFILKKHQFNLIT